MANRRTDKTCVDIRICVDNDVDKAIIKYQAKRVAKDGLRYGKPEAASDLLKELLNTKDK